MSVSILGRNSSGMKKQRCSGFRRLIVATQGAGSARTAISRAFVVVSATTRRTIARPKGDRLLPSPLEGEGRVRGSCHPERSEGVRYALPVGVDKAPVPPYPVRKHGSGKILTGRMKRCNKVPIKPFAV